MDIKQIQLTQIRPGSNDRKNFKNLKTLALSIAKNGLAQPITVRPIETDGDIQYEIVAGERRFRAHQLYTQMVNAGKWPASPHVEVGSIKTIVRELSDQEASAIMLAENTGRQDLNPKEEAEAYHVRYTKYGWSVGRIAEVAGVSEETVKSRMALLNLDTHILELVANKHISLSYANLMADLDHNRQNLAAKLLKSGYVSLADFRRYVMELQEQQAQDTLFDLTSFWVEQVAALNNGPKNGKAAAEMLDLPVDETLPQLDAKYGTPIGDILNGYINDLLDAGRDSEAAAVGQVYANLVSIRKACLPKAIVTD